MRQTLGLWKRLFSERDYRFAENTRGAYLVRLWGIAVNAIRPEIGWVG